MYKTTINKKREWFSQKEKVINNFMEHNFPEELKNEDLLLIQEFMFFTSKDISLSQIRNVYNLTSEEESITSVRIKLAYIAGRTDKSKRAMQVFLDKLDKMLEAKYEGVKEFAEACLAYHKYYDNLDIRPPRN